MLAASLLVVLLAILLELAFEALTRLTRVKGGSLQR